MAQVISKDGTSIAYERAGEGRPLILIDGALSHRSFGKSSVPARGVRRKSQ